MANALREYKAGAALKMLRAKDAALAEQREVHLVAMKQVELFQELLKEQVKALMEERQQIYLKE